MNGFIFVPAFPYPGWLSGRIRLYWWLLSEGRSTSSSSTTSHETKK